jgi:hypothetical protein
MLTPPPVVAAVLRLVKESDVLPHVRELGGIVKHQNRPSREGKALPG